MGVFNNNIGSSGFSTLPGSKYYQTYSITNVAKACSGGICYGDALSETARWNSDYAGMPNSSYPWFLRGGYYNKGPNAGVFGFGSYAGGANGVISFLRPLGLLPFTVGIYGKEMKEIRTI